MRILHLTGRVLLNASRRLVWLIPAAIAIGMSAGLAIDFREFQPLILPLVVLLIYPSMIGVDWSAFFRTANTRLILVSMVVNFFIVPLGAYSLGRVFLYDSPALFAGLALASLLPTSSMTITYTVLAGGNAPGAIKTTIISLILGSTLSPFYLFLMVGQQMPFDLGEAVRTIATVIFLPMAAGFVTFRITLRFLSSRDFDANVRPYLPGVSAIFAITIICISVGMESRTIASNPHLLLRCLAVQTAFYAFNYGVGILAVRLLRLGNPDGLALIYSTVLRNLAISIGLAAGMFGSQAALLVSLAFLIQPVAAAGFIQINNKWQVLEGPGTYTA